MPSLATMQAATPKCPYEGPPLTSLATGTPKTGAVRPCGRVLHYIAGHNSWRCDRHGVMVKGEALVQRQRELRIVDAA